MLMPHFFPAFRLQTRRATSWPKTFVFRFFIFVCKSFEKHLCQEAFASSALSRAAACSDLTRAAIGAEAATCARARPFDRQKENAQKTTILENVIPEIVGFNFDRETILELLW